MQGCTVSRHKIWEFTLCFAVVLKCVCLCQEVKMREIWNCSIHEFDSEQNHLDAHGQVTSDKTYDSQETCENQEIL